MRAFRDTPIKRKLTVVMAVTSLTGLLLTGAAAVGYELLRFHQETVLDLRGQAKIISAASAAALATGDREVVGKILSALSTQREIVFGRVFGADGRLFAEYVRPDAARLRAAPAFRTEGAEIERGLVCFKAPIFQNQQRLGTLMLCADLHELHARLAGGASILAVVLLASLLLGLVLSGRLQRLISDPILNLAQLAQTVAARKDYSLRAPKHGEDEIGLLVERFNDMLGQVQHREASLRDSEQRFRQLAESIKEVFWLYNAAKTEVIYVSPAYEQIWGRTCASLRASPDGWLDAIHPEDRQRVGDAAVVKQVRGDYDEEYRIVRPDGEVRWIRDRAFPVRNEAGEVYRLAGIAEDITAHKTLEKQILEISDREQARIGQDLHDGLCQLLVGIGLNLTALKGDLEEQAPGELARADRMVARLADAINIARHLAQGLYPVNLQREGLAAALEQLAANTSTDFGVACTAECAEGIAVGSQTIATHLYRIAQEAVHNAIKHASPTNILIRLAAGHDRASLTITDNGRGIAGSPKPGAGMGLEIMRYRAGMIGGALEIRPAETGGTIVVCIFQPGATK